MWEQTDTLLSTGMMCNQGWRYDASTKSTLKSGLIQETTCRSVSLLAFTIFRYKSGTSKLNLFNSIEIIARKVSKYPEISWFYSKNTNVKSSRRIRWILIQRSINEHCIRLSFGHIICFVTQVGWTPNSCGCLWSVCKCLGRVWKSFVFDTVDCKLWGLALHGYLFECAFRVWNFSQRRARCQPGKRRKRFLTQGW